MLKNSALVVGAGLLLGGILGFVPGLSTIDAGGRQLLFGVFMTGPFHNGFHLVSGLAGLIAATSARYARWYLRLFGSVYAVLAILGIGVGIPNVNMADNVLHAALAVILLGIGFGFQIDAAPGKTFVREGIIQ